MSDGSKRKAESRRQTAESRRQEAGEGRGRRHPISARSVEVNLAVAFKPRAAEQIIIHVASATNELTFSAKMSTARVSAPV